MMFRMMMTYELHDHDVVEVEEVNVSRKFLHSMVLLMVNTLVCGWLHDCWVCMA
jgi:hypothetical protein